MRPWVWAAEGQYEPEEGDNAVDDLRDPAGAVAAGGGHLLHTGRLHSRPAGRGGGSGHHAAAAGTSSALAGADASSGGGGGGEGAPVGRPPLWLDVSGFGRQFPPSALRPSPSPHSGSRRGSDF